MILNAFDIYNVHRTHSVFCCFQGHVVMGTQAPSVYQQVIEKTKGVMSRTQELARNIEKRLNIDKSGYEGVSTGYKLE